MAATVNGVRARESALPRFVIVQELEVGKDGGEMGFIEKDVEVAGAGYEVEIGVVGKEEGENCGSEHPQVVCGEHVVE